MSTDLVPAEQRAAMEKVKAVATEYGLAATEKTDEFERGLMLAAGMEKLRALLTSQVMKPIMALQGSTLGFRTDKDAAAGYPENVVRDVVCEALLRGFRPVGNEFNIIAGRFYAAKDGCRRRVLEWPGLTKFVMDVSYPSDKPGTAYVEAVASWELEGKPDELVRCGKSAIPIRRNAGMGDDAILGKAERKMYAAVLNRLSSFVIPDGEVEGDVIDTSSRPAEPRRSRLNELAAPPAEAATVTFDPKEQAVMVDEYAEGFGQANTSREITTIQQNAAREAREGRLSPASLSQVNALANQRRAALKRNDGKLFDESGSATERGM